MCLISCWIIPINYCSTCFWVICSHPITVSQNSSRQYAAQLLFDVEPSTRCLQLIFAIALLAAFAISMIDLHGFMLKIFLYTVLVMGVYLALKNNCRRVLQWQPDGQWQIEQGEQVYGARLLPGSVVTPFFSMLNFRLHAGRRVNVWLFRDNIQSEKFRQLRVRLKVEGISSAAHDKLAS